MVTFKQVATDTVTSCTKCHLHSRCKGPVPGQLNRKYGVVFVGEAPGQQEDLSRAPFVGKSGMYLRAIVRESGFDLRYVSYVNVISCRPPKNRNPQDYEIAACRNNLLIQIDSVEPKLVVSLGKFAARIFTDTIELRLDRGRVFFPRPTLAQIPLYHPAFVLRQRKDQETVFKQDMLYARYASNAPSRYLPETCRRCKRPVEMYDEMVLAYCKVCKTKVKPVAKQEGLFK